MLLQIWKKPCKHPGQNQLFKWGDAQNKATRELSKIFDAGTKILNRDALPTHPDSLMNKRTKIPKVEYQTAPPTSVDPDKESKNREQKLPSTIQTNPQSEKTRRKYTKNSRN